MCGIVAYIGKRQAIPIILKGLKRLEYRGYDSAGIGILNGVLSVYKKQGKVSDLESLLSNKPIESTIGIGHTRWATHGEPNDINAHPHQSPSGNISIIHNGIIENYTSIRQELVNKGYKFISETDTEVLVSFIENIQNERSCSLTKAVRIALNSVVGAYAIVVMSRENETQLIAARKGSPLVIGIGKEEFFFASDASPIIEHTDKVVYLKDQEVAVVEDGKLLITDLEDVEKSPYIQTIEMELEAIEKGGYEHFMLKEIYEQPKSLKDCMRGRLNAAESRLVIGGIRKYEDQLINTKRITIIACGTSWHAGLVAEYFIEEFCRIPVEVEYASEFRYRKPIINEGDVVLAISQSGETADTLAAIELAKSKKAIIFGICNVVGSSIPRASHEGIYTHAGPEIGVASTKSFTAQLTVMFMLMLKVAYKKGSIETTLLKRMICELDNIPKKIEKALMLTDRIKEISSNFIKASNFLYLGRGYNFPVALEGALKLKEISYIHAEGYPAAEMKHGPIALIDEDLPVVFIATKDSSYQKIMTNIQEVKARKGKIIAIVSEGDTQIKDIADYTIEIPYTEEVLTPLISVIPLQLLAYHIAIMRGCNVDQPRNLAKSVTVE